MEKTKRHRFSARERKQVFDMFEGHCAYCGCEVTFRGMQMDHKEPLYIGGEDKIENLYPACRSCNHYKHSLGIEEFRKYLAGINQRLMRDSIPFKVAVRFGIVKHMGDKVIFYFERCEKPEATGEENQNDKK